MKQLPEKWAIKRTPENAREINAWYTSQRERVTELSIFHVYITNDLDFYSCVPKGYEEITIEQWREAVKYGWKELKSDELITGGELEGYEAPFDIPKWNTKKGDLWTYTKNGWYEFENEALPAEWVETWKPRYKAKEKKRVVKSGWVIQVIGGLGIPILDGSTSRPALFNTQADCIEWVKQNGTLDEFYTFLEVDYITEE